MVMFHSFLLVYQSVNQWYCRSRNRRSIIRIMLQCWETVGNNIYTILEIEFSIFLATSITPFMMFFKDPIWWKKWLNGHSSSGYEFHEHSNRYLKSLVLFTLTIINYHWPSLTIISLLRNPCKSTLNILPVCWILLRKKYTIYNTSISQVAAATRDAICGWYVPIKSHEQSHCCWFNPSNHIKLIRYYIPPICNEHIPIMCI